jgi:hypothetical protein
MNAQMFYHKTLFVVVLGFFFSSIAATVTFAQDVPSSWTGDVFSLSADALEIPRQEQKVIYRKQNPATIFALRNNIAYDATGTMNLALEVALGQHASIGGIFGFKAWDRFLLWDNSPAILSKWRHLSLVPEFRYYLGEVSRGHYVGADLMYIHYNMGSIKLPFNLYPVLHDQRVQGDLLGGGLFYGYAFPLGNHWRIEAELGLSAGWYSDIAYECPSCGRMIGSRSGAALLPKIGVNIVYTINKKEKGEEK